MSGKDPRRRTPQGVLKAPAFVRFNPLDSGEDCDEIFWEHPLTFSRRVGRNKYIDSWGIYPHNSPDGYRDVDGERIFKRKYRLQNMGLYIASRERMPEEQFIDALIADKIIRLSKLDLGDLIRRDYTLYIAAPFIPDPVDNTKDRYWRRIRVSGGLGLGVFADKILSPLWGWERNLHAHAFHDFKDGAMFGPEGCNAIDMMHLDKSGYAYIPEETYTIAHLLRQKGDVIGYHYDFGDNWWLDIHLEEIASSDESTGAVVVLDGAGDMLPEDNGTFGWADQLKRAQTSPVAKRQAVQALFEAKNYKQNRVRPDERDWFHWDFDGFDMERTRKAIKEALESNASVPSLSKHFVQPIGDSPEEVMSPSGVRSRLGIDPQTMKKGTRLLQTPLDPISGVFLEEGVNTRRKNEKGNTACAQCGNPNDLRACSQCKQWYYCSKECQKMHWKEGHKWECKA